jgi:nitroreductase
MTTAMSDNADVDRILTSTRSARKTLDVDAPVDLDEIKDCLRIGLHAANGTNLQSWRWLLITEPDLRARIAALYRKAYLDKVGGQLIAGLMPQGTPEARIMSSTEWLVEHLEDVPVLVIPCYEPTMPRTDGDESFHLATVYGSIFPAVWNFQLALRTRGYGTCITTLHLHHERAVRDLLAIPDQIVQGCLLPVARLRKGHRFSPAPRRAVDDVIGMNGWEGA